MTDGIYFNHEENEFSRRGSGFAGDVHHRMNALETNAHAGGTADASQPVKPSAQ